MRYLILFFCLSLTFCSVAFGDQNLISKNQITLLEQSDSISAVALEKMAYRPSTIDIFNPDSKDNVKLNSEQKKKLIKLLSKAIKINPDERLPTCNYLPGVSFNFHTKSNHVNKVISILLCFNCDLWAVNNENIIFPSINNTVALGDSKPEREQLMALVKELFGKDFIK